ncbi:5-methylribose kinase [Jeotgalibacillus alimentarius]|uniref:S-methyl-5-thioribose kinase n=1 Tax=Jeotgalibacillus alimentarius TaxID=135826 RepID=A0A0C2R8T3_9BACL|nr:S-methyl-5-thioribose kinase [Jeotgalibacillus alimentarius]KIL46690.1 5-methylribose kinase [Jeotgalibacillus alimentarius]
MAAVDFKSEYFTMSEEDVVRYVKTEMDFFDSNEQLSCKEIGDGNLNYVFRVKGSSGKSVILKQAGPVARISNEFKVSPDRNRIESEILRIQGKLAEGFVPEVYHYDPVMNCMSMEDLSDYTIMRDALLKKETFPQFADHITTFMVNTLLMTSDVVMNHKDKKALVKDFINPDLCEITEDLVFTEPFFPSLRNDVFPALQHFVEKEIWGDEKLKLETAKLKFEFMTNAQSLIHGDLHTGSIFIKKDATKVIDPEFAFYGPAGYDVGNVIANLTFAYMNGAVTMKDQQSREDFLHFIEQAIIDVIDLFKSKFEKAWQQHASDQTAAYEGYMEYYLQNILRDTAAVAGCELIRRTIGLAHVKDLTSISEEEDRAAAEKACLTAGKTFIMNRESYSDGTAFFKVISDAIIKD